MNHWQDQGTYLLNTHTYTSFSSTWYQWEWWLYVLLLLLLMISSSASSLMLLLLLQSVCLTSSRNHEKLNNNLNGYSSSRCTNNQPVDEVNQSWWGGSTWSWVTFRWLLLRCLWRLGEPNKQQKHTKITKKELRRVESLGYLQDVVIIPHINQSMQDRQHQWYGGMLIPVYMHLPQIPSPPTSGCLDGPSTGSSQWRGLEYRCKSCGSKYHHQHNRHYCQQHQKSQSIRKRRRKMLAR